MAYSATPLIKPPTKEAPEPVEKPTKKPKEPKEAMPSLMDDIIGVLGPKMAKRGCAVGTPATVDYLAEPNGYILTGIHALDYALTGGQGFPLGRFIELFGNESCGKTALCEYLIGRWVSKAVGGTVSYLDYEKSMDLDHLACYGVGPKSFLYPNLLTLEDGWDYISSTLARVTERNNKRVKLKMEKEPPLLYVWDSLAQSPAEAEMSEKNHEDHHVGLVARGMAKGFRKHTRQFSECDALCMFVNQVRDKVGSMGPGPKTDTPGGRAAKFAYSIRMRMAMIQTIKKGDVTVGQLTEITTVKNKHHPKNQKAKIVLSFFRGIDADWSNFLWFQEHGYIEAAGKKGFTFRDVDSEPFRRSEFGEWVSSHRKPVKDAIGEIHKAQASIISEGAEDDDAAAADDT